MISDKNLVITSLAVAVAGLILLFIITVRIEPKEVKISEIHDNLLGQEVVVKGIASSYFTNGGNVFLNVKGGAEIKVVMFEKEARKQPWVYDLQKGDSVSVQGRVQLYKNELEIIATTIKVFNSS